MFAENVKINTEKHIIAQNVKFEKIYSWVNFIPVQCIRIQTRLYVFVGRIKILFRFLMDRSFLRNLPYQESLTNIFLGYFRFDQVKTI